MIDLDVKRFEELWEIFREQGEDAITWNHYELADRTSENNPEVWKAFLMNPEFNSWSQSELTLVQGAELKKMVKGAAKTRSVGQAQLINAFSKLNENTSSKEGPVFIYTHVPLNSEQEHSPNVNKPKTIFIKED